jgi:hypothetical protein
MLLKKKIVLIIIMFLSFFMLIGCGSSAYNKLDDFEQDVFNSLLININDFYNPSEIRVIGASEYEDEDGYVFIEIQGTNRIGGTINRWYLLQIESGYVGATYMNRGDIIDVDDWSLDITVDGGFDCGGINSALNKYWEDLNIY